jgi:hypothetical protein
MQPYRAIPYGGPDGGPIGKVAINPPWTQSPLCPTNLVTGVSYDYCHFADIALVGPPAVMYERKIGISVNEGLNGSPGSSEIGSWAEIDTVLPPEVIWEGSRIVGKSGSTTGTTYGEMTHPVTHLGFRQCGWSPGWNPNACVWLGYQNVVRVAKIGMGRGDSGGPVFARVTAGGPLHPLGIVVSGGPFADDEMTCTAGPGCIMYFARWDMIENVLGLGKLMPGTKQSSPSPPPPSLPVSISGPTNIRPGATCTWQMYVGGGTAPYTYQWTNDGIPVATSYEYTGGKGAGATAPFFTLRATANDAAGQYGEAELTVYEDASAPVCLI